MQKRIAWGLFFLLSAVHLIALHFGFHALGVGTKPLLVLGLIVVSLVHSPRPKKMLFIALGASFLGDVLLMGTGMIWFLLGILSFLITQVLYSAMVVKTSAINLRGVLFGALLYGAYGTGLIYFLFPSLGVLAPAVILYAIAICTFGVLAFQRFFDQPSKGISLLLGASLFILSDSMIAFNQFYVNYDYFTTEVMLTYLLAQGLIVNYFLNNS